MNRGMAITASGLVAIPIGTGVSIWAIYNANLVVFCCAQALVLIAVFANAFAGAGR